MKIIQILFCCFLFLFHYQSQAQLGKIFTRQGDKINKAGKKLGDVPKNTAKRVGTNANNKINSGVDRKVDKAIDKVLNPRIQRGSQKGTIQVKNSDGSNTERKMTKKEKKALKKQDKEDKKKAKKAKRDKIKYGQTDEDLAEQERTAEQEIEKERMYKKQDSVRQAITARYTGISTFLLARRSPNGKMDSFWVNSYVDRTRTAVKVRHYYKKDTLVHWCINNRATMQIDDLQGGKNVLPLGGEFDYKKFKFQREYKMQTRDSIICAHYLGSNEQFEIEVWADESVKARHFEQFVVDKYVKSSILNAIALLGKMNVQIREAVVTDKISNEVFYYTFSSANTNAPSSSHFKSDDVKWDFDGFLASGGMEQLSADLQDAIDEIEFDAEMAKEVPEPATERLRDLSKSFKNSVLNNKIDEVDEYDN
jgi:hypothetical protein